MWLAFTRSSITCASACAVPGLGCWLDAGSAAVSSAMPTQSARTRTTGQLRTTTGTARDTRRLRDPAAPSNGPGVAFGRASAASSRVWPSATPAILVGCRAFVFVCRLTAFPCRCSVVGVVMAPATVIASRRRSGSSGCRRFHGWRSYLMRIPVSSTAFFQRSR
jgi:hypothetical protein